MKTYSPLFETIYDEQKPSSELGRGTHYSILRAIVAHDHNGDDLNTIKNLDFAVIWDEDHDTRIIPVLEEICETGYLSLGIIFGERKGSFHFVLNDSYKSKYEDFKKIYKDIENIVHSTEEDTWCFHMDYLLTNEGDIDEDSEITGIINASDKQIEKYLKEISEKWNLGLKDLN